MISCRDCKWFMKDVESGPLGVGWCYVPMPACVQHSSEIFSYTVCERSEFVFCSGFMSANDGHKMINQNRSEYADLDVIDYYKNMQ